MTRATVTVRPDLAPALGALSFEEWIAAPGRLVKRSADGRRRTRAVTLGGREYFVKVHDGPGWRELLKRLATLDRPVYGAANEARALRALPALGIETPRWAAHGQATGSPAARRSFVATEALGDTEPLDLFLARELVRRPPRAAARLRHATIAVLARVARTLHENGFCHRDLYLCHFLVRRADAAAATPAPVLIDLHRARAGQPRLLARWRRRDLAALLLSAAELSLTRADRLRFVRAYRGGSTLRAALAGERRFWSRVTRRAARVRERHRARYGVDPARAGSGA